MSILCSAADVIDRAGVGADTSSSAMITRAISRAEQRIVAETRRNWTTGYASVPASVKELLKVCAAAHAAKEIINYDTTGFFSRQAAEIALDVNHDDFTTTLKSLKDLDTTKIRDV